VDLSDLAIYRYVQVGSSTSLVKPIIINTFKKKGHALESTTVRHVSGPDRTVTDRAGSEIKELVGGYYIVKAADFDAAMKIAESYPDYDKGGTVEIREVMEFAWLTTAAKNRTIELFRKLKSEKERSQYFVNGTSSIALSELFLEHEIEDSQLRMIFTACHPSLDSRDQIAFALKSIAGFSQKEIAAALLLKDETIKKRLSRARATIRKEELVFEIPQGAELEKRRIRVLEVLYLMFNEGFHSSKKDMIIRKELCGEAMRLCKKLIDHSITCDEESQALFALMCFHSARLDSKIDALNEIIDLRQQDRSKWYFPLIAAGNATMIEATKSGKYTAYHYEAAIACEHLSARKFIDTKWDKIIFWYKKLQEIAPSPFNLLNMAVVNLQQDQPELAKEILTEVDPNNLGQRDYLYYGCMAQYHKAMKQYENALDCYSTALEKVKNESERRYMEKKYLQIQDLQAKSK